MWVNYKITIIKGKPFISHSLGRLVKAGVVKVTQDFVFLSVWKGHLCWFDLSEERFVCSLYYVFFFFPFSFFSCIRVSDCPGKVTQSALLTHNRAFMDLRDFSGNYNLKNSGWAAEKLLTAVINMIFFLLREKIKTFDHIHSSVLVMILLFNTKTTLFSLAAEWISAEHWCLIAKRFWVWSRDQTRGFLVWGLDVLPDLTWVFFKYSSFLPPVLFFMINFLSDSDSE